MKKYAQERELEDLLIDGISGGAVGGKLDQKARVFEVVLDRFMLVSLPPICRWILLLAATSEKWTLATL